MIYTVTLNPALDKTVEIPSLTVDSVNRITTMRTDPGGKGINVSKVIRKLGRESTATGILGGYRPRHLRRARSHEDQNRFPVRGGGNPDQPESHRSGKPYQH